MEMSINKEALKAFVDNFYDERILDEATDKDKINYIFQIHSLIFGEIIASYKKAVSEEATSILAFYKYLEYLNETAKKYPKEIMIIKNNMGVTYHILDDERIKELEVLDRDISNGHITLIDRCQKDGYINETNPPLVSKLLLRLYLELAIDYVNNVDYSPKQKMDKILFSVLTLKS